MVWLRETVPHQISAACNLVLFMQKGGVIACIDFISMLHVKLLADDVSYSNDLPQGALGLEMPYRFAF